MEIYLTLCNGDDKEDFLNKYSTYNMSRKGDHWFYQKHFGPTKIDIYFVEFSFEDLQSELPFLMEQTWEICSEYARDEPMGVVKPGESLEGAIISPLLKYAHRENYSIFDLATDIFISLVNGHKMTNGNKRTSFAFLISLLSFFGLFFKTKGFGSVDYSRDYASDVKDFSTRLEGMTVDIFTSPIREEIKAWIIANTVISIVKYNKH